MVMHCPAHDMSAAPGIFFCSSADGTRLAYTVSGAGPPLVLAALHNTDADLIAPGPCSRHWIDRLSLQHRMLRFDARGSGLSERQPPRLTLEACAEDFLAVVDAAGYERFSIVALSYGVSVALPFAAAHPQRVERLVCYGGAVRGRFHRHVSDAERADLQTVLKLLASGHSDRSEYGSSFRRMFYEQFFPDADARLLGDLDRIIVKRFTGDVAATYAAALFDSDFTKAARALALPVFVLHALKDRFCAFEEGRYLASLIAGATFMAVESNHNMPLASDADWPATILAIERFLNGEARAPTALSLTLTPRQVQVLRLITQGRTDEQIARELGLSHRTVEMHVARRMAALGCHTRAEAAARWVQLGQADG